LPVLKPESDRKAIAEIMVSGDERVFGGTDAAPHWDYLKKGDDPRAGIFFGQSEYLQYFKVFEKASAIDKFEDFTSCFGAETYGFPLNTGTITIAQEEWRTPIQENGIRFCMGGELLKFKIVGINRG
jgi:dihydroorotase